MELFHIVTGAEWDAVDRQRAYAPASLASVGFVHLSTAPQLLASARRYFSTCEGRVVVLSVRRTDIDSELKFEEAHGEWFPHLYAPLEQSAITSVAELRRNAAGEFDIPLEWEQRRSDFFVA